MECWNESINYGESSLCAKVELPEAFGEDDVFFSSVIGWIFNPAPPSIRSANHRFGSRLRGAISRWLSFETLIRSVPSLSDDNLFDRLLASCQVAKLRR